MVLSVVDLWVLLSPVSASVHEATVTLDHDTLLVHASDVLSAKSGGIFEGVAGDVLAGLLGDDLQVLDDSRNDLMFQTGVLALSVLSECHDIDLVIDGALDTRNGLAWSHVGEQVEFLSQGNIDRSVTLADRGGERTLESVLVLLDGLQSLRQDQISLLVDNLALHVVLFPLNWHYVSFQTFTLELIEDLED